jgi:hypothetical protein
MVWIYSLEYWPSRLGHVVGGWYPKSSNVGLVMELIIYGLYWAPYFGHLFFFLCKICRIEIVSVPEPYRDITSVTS